MMRDQKRIPIYWQGELVGYMANVKVDMFHHYGDWHPVINQATEQLLAKLKSDCEEWVGLNENKPTHYISIESFSTTDSQITIDLAHSVNPPQTWR